MSVATALDERDPFTLQEVARGNLWSLREPLNHFREHPKDYIESHLLIRTKDRLLVPLLLNDAQERFYLSMTGRDIILKPRQLGFTTVCCALMFTDCLLHENTSSVLVAHEQYSTEIIFGIVQRFWEALPAAEKERVGKPSYSSRRELVWPKIGSQFYVGTAGAREFGRGQTISNLHCSELAAWTHPDDALPSLLEAVPPSGRIVIESTAKGVGNVFHRMWVQAKEERHFTPHFYVWHQDPEYRLTDHSEPLGELSADERRLVAQHGLDEGQLRWRRDKVRNLGAKFRQEYPEDDVTCFLSSGRCCFDTVALQAALARIGESPAGERIEILKPAQDRVIGVAPAELLVWQRPRVDGKYVIGADVGEGLEHGDASCACVLDRVSGQQVAALHGRIPPDRFGLLLDALGRLYNLALLGVERNNHGHSTLNTLRNTCRYPNLYWHMRYDQRGTGQPQLGWPTDAQTKPILVDMLGSAVSNGDLLIRDPSLVAECFTFVQKDSGRQEAQDGEYDDRVIAAGIAWQLRQRPVSFGSTTRPPGW